MNSVHATLLMVLYVSHYLMSRTQRSSDQPISEVHHMHELGDEEPTVSARKTVLSLSRDGWHSYRDEFPSFIRTRGVPQFRLRNISFITLLYFPA